jgi:hypothetical protein
VTEQVSDDAQRRTLLLELYRIAMPKCVQMYALLDSSLSGKSRERVTEIAAVYTLAASGHEEKRTAVSTATKA